MPKAAMPDLFLEIMQRTGFAKAFTHLSERPARVEHFETSLCAALIAEACNIGIEPVSRQDVPALRRERLTWINQNFIRPEPSQSPTRGSCPHMLRCHSSKSGAQGRQALDVAREQIRRVQQESDDYRVEAALTDAEDAVDLARARIADAAEAEIEAAEESGAAERSRQAWRPMRPLTV